MSGTRVLWGQVLIVFAIILMAIWMATEWTAWRLGFQPELGRPWFELAGGVPVYYPPAFFAWWYAYDAYAPSVFIEGAYIAASGGLIASTVAIILSILRGARSEERPDLRFGTLGHNSGNPRGRSARLRWSRAWIP